MCLQWTVVELGIDLFLLRLCICLSQTLNSQGHSKDRRTTKTVVTVGSCCNVAIWLLQCFQLYLCMYLFSYLFIYLLTGPHRKTFR